MVEQCLMSHAASEYRHFKLHTSWACTAYFLNTLVEERVLASGDMYCSQGMCIHMSMIKSHQYSFKSSLSDFILEVLSAINKSK